MKITPRFYTLLLIGLLVSTGCSALPGLRVLTGQDSAENVSSQVIEQTNLVMGDKSGTTDPSLTAAADRIEQANGGTIDIIQIGRNEAQDVFEVDLLWSPDNLTAESTTADVYDTLRRFVELTWQGTMQESQGSDMIYVNVLSPIPVTTLDSGSTFIAQVNFKLQIPRSEAISYLSHRPNDVQDFVNLIADGKMIFDSPTQQELYEGTPNHPVFMLAAMQAQINAQQASQ
jgi:hypothetical protein